MKIGIITFHFVHNQGAVLQCFALKKYLESQGHEVEIIDYRPKYHTVRYSAWKNPFRYAAWYAQRRKKAGTRRKIVTAVRSFARCMRLNIKGRDKANARLFADFVKKNLPCTRQYTSFSQIQNDPPKMDAYISGSDQLWNPDLLDHRFDKAYFLDFGGPDCKRIVYAVSMGKEFSVDECDQLRNLCVGLDAISLRERTPVAIDAIGRDVHICIDPTLLLNADDYADIENPGKEKEPYIFVYGFETSESIQEALDLAVAKYGCRVINGSPGRVRIEGENVRNVRDYAPDRFLSYIRNAECVVTNSFHGTVFSIIYRKRFVTVPHSTRGRRMTELLSKLGLRDALWGTAGFSLDQEIDYGAAYEKLHDLKQGSMNFLNCALAGMRGEEIEHSGEDVAEEDANGLVNSKYQNLQAKFGYYKDEAQLKKSASGGAASMLAETVLNCQPGAVVYGVVYRSDYKSACFERAETVQELERFKGSKYIAAEMKLTGGESVLASVASDLEQGRTVLFVGLGCQVGAVKQYVSAHHVDDAKLYTIDIICHGPTLPAVQDAYISALEKKFSSKIVEFSMKYKKTGWTPNYVHAVFANGTSYDEPFYETELGYAFKTYSKASCYACQFKGDAHAADLTIGDYWGLKHGMQGYHKNGVSILFSRTAKGEELLGRVDASKFVMGDADIDLAIKNNRMFEVSRKKPAYSDQFGKDLEERGLHYACTHSPGYRKYRKAALKKKLKRLLKA